MDDYSTTKVAGLKFLIKIISFLSFLVIRRWKVHPYLEHEDIKNLTRNWITVKICQMLPPSEEKNELLRSIGVKIGKNVFISPDVVIDPLCPEMIRIEDDVFIGWGARLFTHIITPEGMTKGIIVIGKGAFIGGFTTIRPYVIIGDGAYIGSDSLVTKSIPNGSKAYGIPAKIKNSDVEELFIEFVK